MSRALPPLLALLAAACSPSLMELPTGPGLPVDSAAASAALQQATAGCASIRTLTAEIGVSGSAGGRRLRGRLLAGAADPDSVRLEAVAPFGQPLFIFVAASGEATLLLPRDDRVLEAGRPAEVLEALTGVPIDGEELAAILTGCVDAPAPQPSTARQFGDTWLVMGGEQGDDVYLRREEPAQPWGLVARVRPAAPSRRPWRAEFADRQADVPRSIRLTSIDDGGGTGRSFDLRLALSQVDVNTPLGPEVFTVRIPPDALPVTLDELRAAGPMASQSDDR
jgi:hypothetical protein